MSEDLFTRLIQPPWPSRSGQAGRQPDLAVRGGGLDLLDENAISRLHNAALQILSETGLAERQMVSLSLQSKPAQHYRKKAAMPAACAC